MGTVETVFHLSDDALGLTITRKKRRNDLAHLLRASGQWLEVVPGAEGLTVQYDPLTIMPDAAQKQLEAALAAPVIPPQSTSKTWVIPVCYEASYALDMTYVCAQTGLTPEEIIARHTRARHSVDMIGFTPGFAYLEGGAPELDVPRLKTPHTYLPAGAIGLAGGLCGLYALPGPGGWPIIGRTPMALFDVTRADPFSLEPGDEVRFEAISSTEFESWTP